MNTFFHSNRRTRIKSMASSYPQPNYANYANTSSFPQPNYANGGIGGGGGVYNTQPVRSVFPLLSFPHPPFPSKLLCLVPFFFSMDLTIVSTQVPPMPMAQYPATQYPATQYPPTQYPTTQYPTTSGGDTQAQVQAPQKETGKKRRRFFECFDWCHVPCCSCCYDCCCQ